MRKPRNKYMVVTIGRKNGRPVFERHPAVSTEEKAREYLENLGTYGFIKYNGETILQYSPAYGKLLPARWIDRS